MSKARIPFEFLPSEKTSCRREHRQQWYKETWQTRDTRRGMKCQSSLIRFSCIGKSALASTHFTNVAKRCCHLCWTVTRGCILNYQQRNLQLQQLWQAAQSVSPAFVSRPMGFNANPGPNPQHVSYKQLASGFYAYHQFKMLYFVGVCWAVD